MEELLLHLVKPLLAHPDAMEVQTVDSDEVTLLEVKLHAEDRESLLSGGGRTVRSIRNIVSAAAGVKRASVDIVDEFGDYSAEE